jgi:hypothetical protein
MMDRWIKHISGVIPHTNKSIDIELNGKNLIITGMNGTGKTSLLRAVFEKLNVLVIQKEGASLSATKQQLLDYESDLRSLQKGTIEYDSMTGAVNTLQNKVDAIEKGLRLVIPDSIQFSSLYDDRKAVICFFEERHFSEIAPAAAAKGLSEEEENAQKQTPAQRFGNNLEQHLVNLANRRQWAKANDNDIEKTREIDDWFTHFERQLKKLFEDESAHLETDSTKTCEWDNLYYICGRCNGIKSTATDILDCCDAAIDVSKAIKCIVPGIPDDDIIVDAQDNHEATKTTANLLNRCYNEKNTGNRRITRELLHEKIFEEYSDFIKYRMTLKSKRSLPRQKDEAKQHLLNMARDPYPFSVFWKWHIWSDPYLSSVLEFGNS